jgi:ATP-dependent DNA helicase RecG
MNESQYLEWKSSWRDEHLQWVCGFANAEGGVLEIGKDDHGQVVGIENARKLMEDLPNKIRDILGILAAVNIQHEYGKDWLAIEVEPYPFPVSLRGHYYFRSGSTNQELKGAALDRFLLRKQGRTWDSVPIPHIKPEQLSEANFTLFKKLAAKSERITKEDLELSRVELLEKLHLFENGYLNRAGVLLFHAEPQRFITGASVKVGFFLTDTDLRFQDEITECSLFQQLDKTMELLLTKYLIAGISYEGIQRLERYPYPESALREAVTNAIAHKAYDGGNPIQISVYRDKIIIWNQGVMPERLNIERLREKHPSIPFNPAIANTFFRAGLIEAWGRGTVKMIEDCTAYGIAEPIYKYDVGGFWIEFRSNIESEFSKNFGETSGKLRGNLGKTSVKILELVESYAHITIPEMASRIGVTERAIEMNIRKLQQEGLLSRKGGAKGGHWEVN